MRAAVIPLPRLSVLLLPGQPGPLVETIKRSQKMAAKSLPKKKPGAAKKTTAKKSVGRFLNSYHGEGAMKIIVG